MEYFFHRYNAGIELGEYGTEFAGYVRETVFERVISLGADDPSGNKLMGSSVGFDNTIPGLLRPAIYSDNPHAKDLGPAPTRTARPKSALRRALPPRPIRDFRRHFGRRRALPT